MKKLEPIICFSQGLGSKNHIFIWDALFQEVMLYLQVARQLTENFINISAKKINIILV